MFNFNVVAFYMNKKNFFLILKNYGKKNKNAPSFICKNRNHKQQKKDELYMRVN